VADLAVRLPNLNRDYAAWTDRTIDPNNADQCIGALRAWAKKQGRRTDPGDYLIRARKDQRSPWITHRI
jgi:hypothetical protein